MVQEPGAPDRLFFRVFRFLSPPQPTDGLRGPRQRADWEVLLLVSLRSSLFIILGSYTTKQTGKRPEDSVSFSSIKIVSLGQLYPNESSHTDLPLLHRGILD